MTWPRRDAGLSAAFVAVVVGLQWVPLCNVLGYEYAMAVGATVVVLGSARVIRSHGARARVWTVFWRHAGFLAGWVAVATLVSLANMARVRNCEPHVGLAYMALFGLGAVPLTVANGMIARHGRTPLRRAGLAALGPAVSLAATLFTLATQPAIVAYDSFFGYYAGSIYDESLTGFWPHVAFRAWTVATVVVLVSLLGVAAGERGHAARALLAAALALTGWALRGEAGVERNRAYVEEALGGFAQTEHFDIYYDASAYRDRRRELMLYDHEATYAQLERFWGVTPPRRLRSFVYGNADQKGELMGGRRTMVAKIWLGEMHITWRGMADDMLAHEMAHLFLREDGYGPLKLASRNGLVPLMALVEGAATAAAGEGDELDVHAWSAAIHDAGLGDDLTQLLGPTGFWGRYSRLAYTLTGSFSLWLIETRGAADYRRSYRRGDFEEVYGEPLADLVAAWTAWLSTIALTDEQVEAARFRFDRPSLFGRTCARSIATRMDEADAFLARGRVDEATRCFASIVADDPTDVNARMRVAQRLFDAGEVDAAAAHAAAIEAEEGAGVGLRARAAELLADIAWVRGDVAGAAAAYASLVASVGTEGDRRRVLAKQLAATPGQTPPATRDAIRRYLVDRPSPPVATTAAELAWVATAEATPLARYLAALRASSDEPAAAVPVWLDASTVDALEPPHRRRALQLLAEFHTARGDADAACAAWGRAAEAAMPRSGGAAVAAKWLDRCELGVMPPRDR